MTNILGISAFYHDSAAALLVDGKIVFAAQEERFTRKKHDSSFPEQAVRHCLAYAGLTLDELDAVVFYDKPFLKLERILETYYQYAPRGVGQFQRSMPIWLKEKVTIKKGLREGLAAIGAYNTRKLKLLFTEHHLAHAASAFYPSPFTEAAILTLDGVGEWATASIAHGKNGNVELLQEMHFPDSLGLLYSAFTYFLGFKVNSGEYKLMGLAPYGNAASPAYRRYVQAITETLVSVFDDGSIKLHQDYFDYAVGLKMIKEKKWATLFGFKRRKPEDKLLQSHCDCALAIQTVTEDIVLKLAREARRLTKSKNLCLAGGVALNCVANGKILQSGLFEHVWIQPAAGDAGGALGAAYATHHMYFQHKRLTTRPDAMQGSYLGPEYADRDIEKIARKYKAKYTYYADTAALLKATAGHIAREKAVGWFQGRMEWGPRALGNRSIIADLRSPRMQKKLNLKVKFRESFRPFAPIVLTEDAARLFELRAESPYMLIVALLKKVLRKKVPANYAALSVKDKLYVTRSALPAITHVDFSARVQTMDAERNPLFYGLLKEFKKQTGVGVLINTSFNVRGEPIVCTPEEAYTCFLKTGLDVLVMGNYLFEKDPQAKPLDDSWQKQYELD